MKRVLLCNIIGLVMTILLSPFILAIADPEPSPSPSASPVPFFPKFEGKPGTFSLDNIPSSHIVQLPDEPLTVYQQTLRKKGLREAEIKNQLLAQKKKIAEKQAQLSQLLTQEKNVEVIKKFDTVFDGIAVQGLSAQDIRQLEEKGYKVYADRLVKAMMMNTLPRISVDSFWTAGYMGDGITVAVLDTGIDYTHPDFGSCTQDQFFTGTCAKVIGGYDIINDDADPRDDNGHGTHVAGIIAGDGIIKGIAPQAKLYAYKVLKSKGEGGSTYIIAGIDRAVDPNNDGDLSDRVDVISMSLGGRGNPDDPISKASDNAVSSGVVVVVAAGNSGPSGNTIGSPGVARKVITVGATYKKDYENFEWSCTPGTYLSSCGGYCGADGKILCKYWEDSSPRAGQVTSFSSRGPVEGEYAYLIKPDIVAPGAIICSSRYNGIFESGHPHYKPCLDSEHVEFAGTSMATPVVSGAVALLKQKHPDWTPQEIKTALKMSADDIGYPATTQGSGALNLKKAFNIQEKPLVAEVLTNGLVSGVDIEILGTARGNNFLKYALYYSKGNGFTQNWQFLCSSSQQKDNEVLCTLKKLRENADYSLKLEVESLLGEKYIEYGMIAVRNLIINQPKDIQSSNFDELEIFTNHQVVPVIGTAIGYDFDYYTILLCNENIWDNSRCIKDAVIFSNGGKIPVVDGLLATLDLSKVTQSGYYWIKAEVYYRDGKKTSLYYPFTKIYVETSILEGWPRKISTLSMGDFINPFIRFLNQPTIADMDLDGKKDIIVAYDKEVNVLNYKGESLLGWPVKIDLTWDPAILPWTLQKGPVVWDIDGDKENEIIVEKYKSNLYTYHRDGTLAQNLQFDFPGDVVVDDLDLDGKMELIIRVYHKVDKLAVFDNLGGLIFEKYEAFKSLTPTGFGFNKISPVSIADLDRNSKKEIVLWARYCANDDSRCTPETQMSYLLVLDYQGNILPGWPKEFRGLESPYETIALANLDEDADIEIIVRSWGSILYALNYDGTNVEGWPVSMISNKKSYEHPIIEFFGYLSSGPSVGDLNNDGRNEVVVDKADCINIFNSDGTPYSTFPLCDIFTLGISHVSLANIDTDESLELIFNRRLSFESYITALNDDGTSVEGYPKYLPYGISNIFAEDINGDGKNELFAVGYPMLYVYTTPGIRKENGWSVYQHDAQHTGFLKPLEVTPPLSSIIIDNLDSGFSKVGTWALSGAPNPYNGNSIYAKTTSSSASWSASWIAPLEPGRYEIYAWWTEWPSRSTAVQYEVFDGTTRLAYPLLQNQRTNGGRWNLLGVHDFTLNGKVTLKVKNDGTSYNADAIKFMKIETTGCIDNDGDGYGNSCALGIDCNDNDPAIYSRATEVCGDGKDNDCDGTQLVPQEGKDIILDNTVSNTPTFSKSGFWVLSSGTGSYGSQSIYSKTSESSATWTTPLTPGKYDMYAWWTEWPSRTTAAPYTITHSGGASTVTKNQKEAGSGGKWNLLGTYDFGSTGKVVLTAKGDGTSYNADAIKFVSSGTTCVPVAALQPPLEAGFIRGDANGDSGVNMGDGIFILNYLFLQGQPPSCLDSADTNDDGRIDISDAILILNHLFSGGNPPQEPNQEGSGFDLTQDDLQCD